MPGREALDDRAADALRAAGYQGYSIRPGH
jgi:hypothetical protein